ncbi:type I DNA topoisomerase [Mariniphaga sediminis]|uniref:DNA topoisomerase 1 n=1 Tax=Mariniphaga sediminis TaxID=1628158 RepID=A0A399D394_9BACT|nr:type I DNA topoisomerase [Mariniphaga sediminis]RIH65946.1 type I DNA topoisomerase [Mariniphaga sediminis]
MQENLVIVESPAKAKTIEKFLGKGYTVTSCMGHIRDLQKKDFGIDLEKNYQPKYVITPDKRKIVTELKKLAKEAQTVWLASDEDREGEAIAWHLKEVLKLDPQKTKRIVFHEITKEAIQKAIENPRSIDENLVNAQQARRVLDRIVGFEVSPVLWKKVKPALSAGRVQSVAVRLIVEREREIINFKGETWYRVNGTFIVTDEDGQPTELKAELNKRFSTKKEATDFIEKCRSAEFSVADVVKKPAKRSPAQPFTTSTLQQEASRKLGFSVSQTMAVAQRLYESGKITYMRTDSVNLSGLAINTAKQKIIELHGEEYVKIRKYHTKSKGAQEAHEAIRPTYMNTEMVEGSAQEQRLYELIWKRTMASQMADAKLEKTTVTISVSTAAEAFTASGEVIIFDGFLKVYMESTDEENGNNTSGQVIIPPLKAKDVLEMASIVATQRFSQRPPRYTEASLVKKLEELGIGRPSTYAPTITTIQNRNYVVKEDRPGIERKFDMVTLKNNKISEQTKTETTGTEKSKLFPTDVGMVVNDFLVANFDQIMDFNFTANVEKEFDDIADGEKVWNEMIDKFYRPFHGKVEDVLENSERSKGERILGDDPKTGKQVSVKIGRYGPVAQLGEASTEENSEKPQFASLRAGQHLETITLEEALELFKLPRELGEYENKKVTVSIGRFGPYVRHDNKFVSLGKEDPFSVDLDRAVELIEAKREKDRKAVIQIFEEEPELRVLNGRWGPYISYKKKNYKIPKKMKAEELSLEDCRKIIDDAPDPKSKRARNKK